jgi:hypothetical protein
MTEPFTRKGANKYIKAVFDIDISSLDKDEVLKLIGVLQQIK